MGEDNLTELRSTDELEQSLMCVCGGKGGGDEKKGTDDGGVTIIYLIYCIRMGGDGIINRY